MVYIKKSKDELDLGLSRVTRKKSKPLYLKNNHSYKSVNKNYSNFSNKNSVVVKITGGTSSKVRAIEHFKYITRNNELSLFDENGNEIELKTTINETNDNFDMSLARKDAKKNYHITFSMHGKNDPYMMKEAVRATLKEFCPNNQFYYALHDDTDNTHVHAIILRSPKDIYSKRLEINKSKLNELKKVYAKQLNNHHINAEFKSYSERFPDEKKTEKRKNTNEYKVMDFGEAPYHFKEGNKQSFYLLLENKNGVIKQHWSKGLVTELANQSIVKNDFITLKKLKKDEQDKYSISSWKIEKVNSFPINNKSKSIDGLILDYGKAPYKFEKLGKASAFLIYKNSTGIHQVWDKNILKKIESLNLKKGDKIQSLTETKYYLNQSINPYKN